MSTNIESLRSEWPEVWAQLRATIEEHGINADTEHAIAKSKSAIIALRKTKTSRLLCPSHGSSGARVLFVGASPSPVDVALQRPLSGPAGVTFIESYLKPLGLSRDDVSITHAVPLVLHKGDRPREPSGLEIDEWSSWLANEIDKLEPQIIVALGNVAKAALKDKADFVLRHPMALRAFHDSGEVARKLKQINKALVALPSTQRVSYQVPIAKLDEEKRVVSGIVLEPDDVDFQNDTASLDQIERAAHAFLVRSRVVGDGHSRPAHAEVVESYVAPSDFEMGEQRVRKGTWLMAIHVLDDDLWRAIKAGEYTGLSIGGRAVREPVPENDPIRERIRSRGSFPPV